MQNYIIKKKGRYLAGYSYTTYKGETYTWSNEIEKATKYLKYAAETMANRVDGIVIKLPL
jgi:hypothetical protein